ncbi:MAG: TetR family transcriptional regulator [Flavobacteriales bacterium]|nr:TetR family transcriptional regulator [Flavobacteriales bacterium]
MTPRSPEQFAQIREERRKQILDAALNVFGEDSYHLASMASVAKRANVSKGLIYNYFEGKEQILVTLVEGLFDEVFDSLELSMDVPLTREKFVHILEKTIEIVLANPKRWKLYMALSFQPDVTPVLMERMMPRIQPFMMLMYNYFSERGHKDPMTMMRYYSAILDGVQFHILLDPENFPIEKVKQMMIDQFA